MEQPTKGPGEVANSGQPNPIHPSSAKSLVAKDSPDDIPWEGSPERLESSRGSSGKSWRGYNVSDNPDDFE